MKKIFLTQGQFTIVDDEDYEWLNQFNWHAHYSECNDSYYAVRAIKLSNGKSTSVRMHRIILGLEIGDKRQGDHIHHNTLDNRRSELRIVTCRQNNSNRERKHISKYTGVSWDKGKWVARILINKKHKYLGRYVIEKDASDVYQEALAEL